MRKLKLKEALLKTALGYVAGKRSTRASNPALLIKRLNLIHSLRSQVQKSRLKWRAVRSGCWGGGALVVGVSQLSFTRLLRQKGRSFQSLMGKRLNDQDFGLGFLVMIPKKRGRMLEVLSHRPWASRLCPSLFLQSQHSPTRPTFLPALALRHPNTHVHTVSHRL